jgi:membrane-bound metal-dependent hydrolase YbcI (DUF457 family)
MPTPFGHALGGIGVVWLADGLSRRRRAGTALTLACAALAALPDADLLLPTRHRGMSHSIAAVAVVSIVAAGVTRWVTRRGWCLDGLGWRVALLCGAAYASHLLLDWLGTDTSAPFGLQMLWPITDRWYLSGWDVFPRVERREFLSAATLLVNLKAVLFEAIALGALLAVLWLARSPARNENAAPSGRGAD